MKQNIGQNIAVVIPVLNEEESIGRVLDDIPAHLISVVVVVDNGSTDNSMDAAGTHGAIVLQESERGYGAACLKGIKYLKNLPDQPDIIVFLDGDYSDYPEYMADMISEINNGYDFVLGSRTRGVREYDATLPIHSVLGNRLLALLLRVLFHGPYTDLGPFRAIRFNSLLELNMQDKNYGWTVEMQIKAVRKRLQIKEIPVRYRMRYGGKSKVTGNLAGSLLALVKIMYVIFLYYFNPGK